MGSLNGASGSQPGGVAQVIDAQRLAFVERGLVPPLREGLGVVRAAGRDGILRVLGGILNGLPVGVPVALPPQHLVAGNLEPRQRLAHEVGNHAEIFGDDRARRWR